MRLHHGRTAIELYELQSQTGPGLLLVHELFGCADDWRQLLPLWNGPVYALDFCGHGRAESVRGGAYFAELLVGDADGRWITPARWPSRGRGSARMLPCSSPEPAPNGCAVRHSWKGED